MTRIRSTYAGLIVRMVAADAVLRRVREEEDEEEEEDHEENRGHEALAVGQKVVELPVYGDIKRPDKVEHDVDTGP